jgi:glutaredoxin
VKITVYSRPGCHLCDEALQQIDAIAAGRDDLVVSVIDIESDDDLLRRYLERIPVVEAGGRVLSELVFDPAPLLAALRTA